MGVAPRGAITRVFILLAKEGPLPSAAPGINKQHSVGARTYRAHLCTPVTIQAEAENETLCRSYRLVHALEFGSPQIPKESNQAQNITLKLSIDSFSTLIQPRLHREGSAVVSRYIHIGMADDANRALHQAEAAEFMVRKLDDSHHSGLVAAPGTGVVFDSSTQRFGRSESGRTRRM